MSEMLNDQLLHITHSVISTGTERSGSAGYINLTQQFGNHVRAISPTPHTSQFVKLDSSCILCDASLPVSTIALMRFQLIAALTIPEYIGSFSKIAILGAGPLGIGACMELKRRRIAYSLISERDWTVKNVGPLLKCPVETTIGNKFEYYIDCTGDSNRIFKIIGSIKSPTVIQLLGTPRDNLSMSLLMLHRQNLSLIGGHELTWRTNKERQKKWNELETWYSKNCFSLSSLTQFHAYSKNVLCNVTNHKYNKPIHIMRHAGDPKI